MPRGAPQWPVPRIDAQLGECRSGRRDQSSKCAPKYPARIRNSQNPPVTVGFLTNPLEHIHWWNIIAFMKSKTRQCKNYNRIWPLSKSGSSGSHPCPFRNNRQGPIPISLSRNYLKKVLLHDRVLPKVLNLSEFACAFLLYLGDKAGANLQNQWLRFCTVLETQII